jgi:negative regulator of replication initiation
MLCTGYLNPRDRSIEDITEDVMQVVMPQKSARYQAMMSAAEKYFRLLRTVDRTNEEELAEAEQRLNELSVPFSDDPAFQALLKVEREMLLSGGNDATG